jgi:hypothetical protein
MKNREILQMSNGIRSCLELKGVKLAYAIAKNIKTLEKILEPFNETLKKLQEEHCERDEEGKPIITNGQYTMKDMEKFNSEYDELMNIDVDITLHKIKQSDLPADISALQATIILDMIDED